MNPRQRFLETMSFGVPDRIPLEPGGPRQSTLRAWSHQGLPEGAEWQEYLYRSLGIPPEAIAAEQRIGVTFAMLPPFQEKVLDHRNGHFLVQDWMGAIVEISDEYDYTYLRTAKDFVTRKWHKFPAHNLQEWAEKLRWRYDPDTPARFSVNFPERCRKLQERGTVLRLDFNGPFWQLREWFGFEGLCLLMVEHPDWVEELVAFWSNFVLKMLDRILEHTVPDHVQISEDMAFKLHSMISPAMARHFLQPSWRAWTDRLKTAGCQVITIDSDGYIDELIPLWIEAGITGTWPVEVAAGNDLPRYRNIYGLKMAYGGGIDKRMLAAGGDSIKTELQRIAPVIHSGGYIPGCDHGVPPDISWPNFMEYTRLLAQLTGWL